MHSHGLALLAVLWLPATLTGLSRLAKAGARRHWPAAERALLGWSRLDRPAQLAILLMCVTAAVHVALIQDHARDRLTAGLFALDAAALVMVCLAALVEAPAWRPVAMVLLLGAVGAYGVYVAAGREVVDLTGIATKAAELAGVECLAISYAWRRPRRAKADMTAAATSSTTPITAHLGSPVMTLPFTRPTPWPTQTSPTRAITTAAPSIEPRTPRS